MEGVTSKFLYDKQGGLYLSFSEEADLKLIQSFLDLI